MLGSCVKLCTFVVIFLFKLFKRTWSLHQVLFQAWYNRHMACYEQSLIQKQNINHNNGNLQNCHNKRKTDMFDQMSRACCYIHIYMHILQCVVNHELIFPGQTLNQQYYTYVLWCLQKNLHQKVSRNGKLRLVGLS
jgi:hypothetical protein